MKNLVLLLVLFCACSADPIPNILHEENGACGHPGEPCCLPHGYPYESYCVTDSACVGADLSCVDADGADGAVPGPQCGTCGSTDKKYKYFCDAAFLFIDAQCSWDVACGFHDADYLEVCKQFFGAIAEGRCGAPITSSDEKIDACLAGWAGLSCSSPDNMPADCENFFFGKR
jgi:hypothetical protein